MKWFKKITGLSQSRFRITLQFQLFISKAMDSMALVILNQNKISNSAVVLANYASNNKAGIL